MLMRANIRGGENIRTCQDEHIARYNLFTIEVYCLIGTKDLNTSAHRVEQFDCL
jgi:hypothetical protein